MRHIACLFMAMLLVGALTGCKDRGVERAAGAAESEDAAARDLAAAVVRKFWAGGSTTACDESLGQLVTELSAADAAAIRRLKYQFVNDTSDTVAFEGIVIASLTDRLRNIETALASCEQLATPASKLALLTRVDDVLAGAMLSLRRDLGVEPGEEWVPGSYRVMASGRLWVHGQMLELLAEGSSERAEVAARLETLKGITKNPDQKHEVP